jgi:hypothetical protein
MLRHALPLLLAGSLWGGSATLLFAPADPATGPFPNDSLTRTDLTQKTGLRLDLPVPDCAAAYTDCQEFGVLDQMDGFSLRARAHVRFSTAIDPASLAGGIFFVALDALDSSSAVVHTKGQVIAADQIVWDPATNSAYAKPATSLDQRRRYALVVTSSVTDPSGAAIVSDILYTACAQSEAAYCGTLAKGLKVAAAAVAPAKVVGASVFTTMSASAWLEQARTALTFVPPMATPRWSFSVPGISSIALHMQTGSYPLAFADVTLPVGSGLLSGLGKLVIGSYQSPNFLEADRSIRPWPTGAPLGLPPVYDVVSFNAFLPQTAKPAGGYPVVIFGHGFGDSRFGGPTAVAPALARSGLAVIAINAVGHGFGSQSTVSFTDSTGSVTTVEAGGRSLDVNGDGSIGGNEGCEVLSPVTYGMRDCFRQTVVDLMQLTRAIKQGLDLDGDGVADLDPSRIYYAGESLGAIYGTIFTAVEPDVKAVALNVGGGSIIDIARTSPSYVNDSARMLAVRSPSLLNLGASYDEDYVLPGQGVKTTTVDGAIAIQEAFERVEWLSMPGDPMAFASHIAQAPLPETTARPVLVQFATGDRTVPNPTSRALITAGGFSTSTWVYRHDLSKALVPSLPANPHPYLAFFVSLDGSSIALPGLAGLAISLDAQNQLGGFFAAGGATIPDPNQLSSLLLGAKVFEKLTATRPDVASTMPRVDTVVRMR